MAVGKGRNTWEKHVYIDKLLKGQVSKLVATFGNNGLIIDMHSGDGIGVEKAQLSLFGHNESDTTPKIAIALGLKYKSDVMLCERNHVAHLTLKGIFSNHATFVKNNRKILKYNLESYDWIVAINDPNGPKDQSEEVMREISYRNKRSDFIVVCNESPIIRQRGISSDAPEKYTGALKNRLEGAVKAKNKYAWIKDPTILLRLLSKRSYVRSSHQVVNIGFRAYVYLFTNSIANVNKRFFDVYENANPRRR